MEVLRLASCSCSRERGCSNRSVSCGVPSHVAGPSSCADGGGTVGSCSCCEAAGICKLRLVAGTAAAWVIWASANRSRRAGGNHISPAACRRRAIWIPSKRIINRQENLRRVETFRTRSLSGGGVKELGLRITTKRALSHTTLLARSARPTLTLYSGIISMQNGRVCRLASQNDQFAD